MSTSVNRPSTHDRPLDWGDADRLMKGHYLRGHEIPTTHLVSLPLPTGRYDEPAFAFHAGPQLLKPAHPARCMPPDRHWAIAARGVNSLLFYARTTILPLTPVGETWTEVELPRVSDSVQMLQERWEALIPIMDQASALFFDGGVFRFAKQLKDELVFFIGPPLLPFYRATAPDFWEWLENDTATP